MFSFFLVCRALLCFFFGLLQRPCCCREFLLVSAPPPFVELRQQALDVVKPRAMLPRCGRKTCPFHFILNSCARKANVQNVLNVAVLFLRITSFFLVARARRAVECTRLVEIKLVILLLVRNCGVTRTVIIIVTASFVRVIVSAENSSSPKRPQFPQFASLLFGGSPFAEDMLDGFFARFLCSNDAVH